MKNFNRVLRLALRYRLTFLLVTLSALGVAVLWGGNIGAVYPIVKVALGGQSLQEWVVDEIAAAERNAAELTTRIGDLRSQLDDVPQEQRWRIERDMHLARSRLDAERKAEATYRGVKPYIDAYLPNGPFQTVVLIIALLLAGTVFKGVFQIANTVFVHRLAELTTLDLRKLFYRRTLRMDVAAFGEGGTADLMSRFTHDMQQVAEGLIVLFGKVIREPLKMAACLIGAALISWRLLVLSMLIAPIAAMLIRWLAKTLKRANRRAMEEMAQLYTTLDETFRGITIVKAFTNERRERLRFHRRSKEYFRRAMRIAMYDSLTRPLTEVLGIITISIALLAGAWLVLANETHLMGIRMSDRPLSLAALALFYGLLAGAADPIRKFSDVLTRLQRAMAASDRIYDRLDREPLVTDPPRPVPCMRHQRDLVFDQVDFGYQPDHPVLREVNLTIPFGSTLAIVGPNGCGKSTLAKMIPRLHDPTGGDVRLDGASLRDLRLRDLRRQIGVVTQETLLFDDTVLSNIRYGAPDATTEEVVAAARRAHAHQFIVEELPEGYDTVVGPGGNRLSGGQRQRITLARAILRDPSILILDEATSQIDLQSEREIQAALEEFVRDRTAVIVTHRLAVLALADQVVVMEAGRIVDTGRHDELLARCALYRRLHQLEFHAPADTDDDQSRAA